MEENWNTHYHQLSNRREAYIFSSLNELFYLQLTFPKYYSWSLWRGSTTSSYETMLSSISSATPFIQLLGTGGGNYTQFFINRNQVNDGKWTREKRGNWFSMWSLESAGERWRDSDSSVSPASLSGRPVSGFVLCDYHCCLQTLPANPLQLSFSPLSSSKPNFLAFLPLRPYGGIPVVLARYPVNRYLGLS